MYLNRNRALSLALLFTFCLTGIQSVFPVVFDEGMFAPGQIAGLPVKDPGLKRKLRSDLRMVRRYVKGRPHEGRRRAPSPLSGLLDRPTGRRSAPQVAALARLRTA